MAYFTKFPVLQYPLDISGQGVRFVFVRNLLRRIALSEDLTQGVGVFLSYDIKDGERPEHIAERMYGDPSFHWIVLLCNNIINPYHDWYKSGTVFEEYTQKKYSGFSVYLTKTDDTLLFNQKIVNGCTLTQGSVSDSIKDYAPSFCRVVVNDSRFAEGSATLTLSDSTSMSVTIHRVDKQLFSVNQFRLDKGTNDIGVSEKATTDPLSKQDGAYELPGGVVGSAENPFPSGVDGIDYAGTGTVNLWETYIGRYMGISGDVVNSYAVTNLLYEIERNDEKRTIRVLDPRFKRQAVTELETLLGA